MTIERGVYGGWVVSDVINGYLVSRLYIGYTKRQARQRFIAEHK